MRIISTGNNPDPTCTPGLWPALGWSPEFWAGLLDNLDAPIVVFDERGTVLLANREAQRLLGLGGAVGHPLPDRLRAVTGEAGEGGRRVVVETAEGPGVFNVRRFRVEGHPGAMVAAGERMTIPVGPVLDMGDPGEGASMAGEIGRKVKGPLAGLELYASILDEELTGRDQGDLASIIDEIRQGLREVNEYLASFESMTRTLNLRLEELPLSEVVDEALGTMAELLKAKGVGVLVDQKRLMVLADRELLVQLFLNVIMNAVEAMPGGGRLMIEIRAADPGMAEVVVTDTGPGIDIRRTKEIFNPFYTTKDQPLGLGLPVGRRIAEAHQGRMRAGSDVISGARVSVTLPRLGEEGGERFAAESRGAFAN